MPPRPPALGPAAAKTEAERKAYLRDRERLEQRSILRGLILLALCALLVGLYRAGVERVFYAGWWRHW